MITIKAIKDTFISDSINNCLYHNQNAKKQITFYLPSYQEEKKFKFFIISPKKVVLQLNNEVDAFWASDKKQIAISAIPGVEVSLEAILGKWQVTSNSPLTFR